MSLPVPSALATDLYQLTMMAGYEAAGHAATSTFELFVRELPASRRYLDGGWARTRRSTTSKACASHPTRSPGCAPCPRSRLRPSAFFDEVLPAFRFTGEVWAMDEGEIVFAARAARARDGAR